VTERKYTIAAVGLKIDGFLSTTLEAAGLELDYDILEIESGEGDFETPDIMVKFGGPDVDALLSNKAELLLALEHVTMEMLRMPSEDHSRLSFDANDYRALRIEELRISAQTAAEKVKHTGQYFKFNPMNSRERRVIHLALRNETEIRSESLGSGPQRCVIVYPAGMASLPEPPREEYVPQRRPFGGGGDRGGGRPGGGGGRGGDRDRRGGGRDRARSARPRP